MCEWVELTKGDTLHERPRRSICGKGCIDKVIILVFLRRNFIRKKLAVTATFCPVWLLVKGIFSKNINIGSFLRLCENIGAFLLKKTYILLRFPTHLAQTPPSQTKPSLFLPWMDRCWHTCNLRGYLHTSENHLCWRNSSLTSYIL